MTPVHVSCHMDGEARPSPKSIRRQQLFSLFIFPAEIHKHPLFLLKKKKNIESFSKSLTGIKQFSVVKSSSVWHRVENNHTSMK